MLEDEGYRFMGAAFEVYNQLGYGMAEEIYQQSLEIELSCVEFHSSPNANWWCITKTAGSARTTGLT
jgi:hypothetical protein